MIDWLLAHRAGNRWSPDRATGPAMLALCRWFCERRSAADAYQLAISVNGQAVGKLELDASAPSQTIEVSRWLSAIAPIECVPSLLKSDVKLMPLFVVFQSPPVEDAA
jgi:hypothetical protein